MKGSEQNGCQPSVSQDVRGSAPATNPRTRSASLTTQNHHNSICRDFIWGICTKGSRCAFRHERDVECMKSILKFCHNYLNKTGCNRADCTYLHASREEQASFLNSGQIPKVLAERYAAMSAGTSSNQGNANITHGGEAHSPRGPRVAFPVPPMLPQPLRPVMRPLLVPPPPPPAVPVLTTPVQPGPSAYPAPPPPLNVSPVQHTCQQFMSIPPPQFDATKPPPPLPQASRYLRKRLATSPEAGPSKARKVEENINIDNICDKCVQRQIRVEITRQDLQKYQIEKEQTTELYLKKCEDFEHGKLLMRSIVNPDLYKFLEDYIEEDTTPSNSHQDHSQFAHVSSLAAGITSPSKPLMRQLLQRVFDNGTRNVLEQPGNSLDNPILKSLTSFARSRVAPVKRGTAEVFQTLLDLMCDRNSSDHGNHINETRTNDLLSLESLPSSSTFSSVITEFTQLINSGKAKSPSPEVNSSTLSSPGSLSPPSFSSPVGVPNNFMLSPPPPFIPFQPNIPPPNTRPMFPPSMGLVPGGMPNTLPYNPAVRMGAPPTMTTRPPVASIAPPQQPGQNVVRYPGSFPMPPHYYPPYQ